MIKMSLYCCDTQFQGPGGLKPLGLYDLPVPG